MGEVVRIGSVIIFVWVSYEKPNSSYAVWCYISGEAAGEIWDWSLLGVPASRNPELEECPKLVS